MYKHTDTRTRARVCAQTHTDIIDGPDLVSPIHVIL